MSSAPLADLYEAKADAYSRFGTGRVAEHARRLLPADGRVLDLGCASGGLLELLRDRAGHLAGLELAPSAAKTARRVADEVVVGALEDSELPFAPASFHLVVLADVLEHLVDPPAALARAVCWCRPGGAVLVSTPNIAHWRARLELLRGRWPTEETGTFDAGHLRFFTRVSLVSLLERSGLERVESDAVVPGLRNHLPLERMPARARGGLERAWQLAGRRWPGLLGYQLLAIGRRPAPG